MADIVAAFVAPHDPFVFLNPRNAERGHILEAYAEIQRRATRLRADTAIIIGADHSILFGPKCLPQILVGVGDVSGPVDQLPGIEKRDFENDEPLSRHLVDQGHARGFDLAVSRSLAFDHSVGIPAHLCAPEGARIVPIYIASGVAPYLRKRRALELGQLIAAAVKTFPEDRRVIVIGSGGISHWVGTREMGRVNQDFDRMVLKAVIEGDAAPLLALSDEEIVAQAGNGAMEIRQFLVAMGAAPGGGGEIIAYEAWPGGVTGLGFASLIPEPAP